MQSEGDEKGPCDASCPAAGLPQPPNYSLHPLAGSDNPAWPVSAHAALRRACPNRPALCRPCMRASQTCFAPIARQHSQPEAVAANPRQAAPCWFEESSGGFCP